MGASGEILESELRLSVFVRAVNHFNSQVTENGDKPVSV
jgi:hypothetical protein